MTLSVGRKKSKGEGKNKKSPDTAINTQKQKDCSVKVQSTAKRSPFLVDLVKDVERVEKERMIRHKQDRAAELKSLKLTQKAKDSLINQDLQERNDLGALRHHKRKILEEEKRIRALIEIEKTKGHRKEDRQAAHRAEQKRRHAKLEARLQKNRETIEEKRQAKMKLLAVKLNLPQG